MDVVGAVRAALAGGRLLAMGEGFSLHAGTSVHANDADALSRLCRYGARGPIAEARLSRRDDGRYAYETKKGVTLVLTAQQLVRRLLWLIPPEKVPPDLLPWSALVPRRRARDGDAQARVPSAAASRGAGDRHAPGEGEEAAAGLGHSPRPYLGH